MKLAFVQDINQFSVPLGTTLIAGNLRQGGRGRANGPGDDPEPGSGHHQRRGRLHKRQPFPPFPGLRRYAGHADYRQYAVVVRLKVIERLLEYFRSHQWVYGHPR